MSHALCGYTVECWGEMYKLHGSYYNLIPKVLFVGFIHV